MTCKTRFLLAVGLQVAAVAVVVKCCAGPVGALLFVDMTTAAVERAAERQDVCQLEMFSVIGDNCC